MTEVGDNRLKATDPEKLLQVDIEEIAPLLLFHYQALFMRSLELKANAEKWVSAHDYLGNPAIEDDADLAASAALYRQLADHAGKDKELETARTKVKAGPLEAGRAIDKVFASYRAPIEELMEKINAAQEAYMAAKGPTKIRSAMVTVSSTQEWDFRLLNMRIFCQAIAEGLVPEACVKLDESAIRAMIRGPHGKRVILGLEIFEKVKVRRTGT